MATSAEQASRDRPGTSLESARDRDYLVIFLGSNTVDIHGLTDRLIDRLINRGFDQLIDRFIGLLTCPNQP